MPALNDTEKDLIREMDKRMGVTPALSLTNYTASEMAEALLFDSDDDKRTMLVEYLNEVRVPEVTARVSSLADEHTDVQQLLTDLNNYLAG